MIGDAPVRLSGMQSSTGRLSGEGSLSLSLSLSLSHRRVNTRVFTPYGRWSTSNFQARAPPRGYTGCSLHREHTERTYRCMDLLVLGTRSRHPSGSRSRSPRSRSKHIITYKCVDLYTIICKERDLGRNAISETTHVVYSHAISCDLK